MTIKTFNVPYELCRIEREEISVEAKTEEDAKDIVQKMFEDGEIGFEDPVPHEMDILDDITEEVE